jgi:hypothetical protein
MTQLKRRTGMTVTHHRFAMAELALCRLLAKGAPRDAGELRKA